MSSPLTLLCLNATGHVYAWGWNRHHQVSRSATEVHALPVLVDFTQSRTAEATPTRVSAVAAGGMHSLALDLDGRVWSWGDNTYGQLGVGSDISVGTSPALLSLERRALSISAGWAHSALLTDSHELLTFGFGLYHQLGHGTPQNQNTPLAVDALFGLDASCGGQIVQVACGSWHTAGSSGCGCCSTSRRACDVTRVTPSLLPFLSAHGVWRRVHVGLGARRPTGKLVRCGTQCVASTAEAGEAGERVF